MWRKTEINERLRGKPHLKPVYTHIYNIPERLKATDNNLFVVFNCKTQRYEIHSLANKGNTLSLNVPFRELDARCIEYANKFDLRKHGKRIFHEIEAHNEAIEKSNVRQRSNDLHAVCEEMHPAFRKLAWEGV